MSREESTETWHGSKITIFLRIERKPGILQHSVYFQIYVYIKYSVLPMVSEIDKSEEIAGTAGYTACV